MPMYEYLCNNCGTVSEILTGVSRDEPEAACTDCGGTDLKLLISVSSFRVGRAGGGETTPCGAAPGESCSHCRHL